MTVDPDGRTAAGIRVAPAFTGPDVRTWPVDGGEHRDRGRRLPRSSRGSVDGRVVVSGRRAVTEVWQLDRSFDTGPTHHPRPEGPRDQ